REKRCDRAGEPVNRFGPWPERLWGEAAGPPNDAPLGGRAAPPALRQGLSPFRWRCRPGTPAPLVERWRRAGERPGPDLECLAGEAPPRWRRGEPASSSR